MTGDAMPMTARVARAVLNRPAPWLRMVGQREPVWRDGRCLHPSLQLLLALSERTGSLERNGDWPRQRAEMRRLVRLSSPVFGGVHVTDRLATVGDGVGSVPPVPVRVYRPHRAGPEAPAVVFIHGGGFAVGDLDTHDPTCRLLAVVAGVVVVAVDYRLAPEAPFPAAVDDVTTAWRWVAANAASLGIDAGAVGVMGDSAGGNLAAVLCQELRALDLAQPVAQCLIYPLVDARFGFATYDTFAEGFGLSRESAGLFRAAYAPDADLWDDPRVSPMCAKDLSGLAPAYIATAGFDILRDEGHAYAAALADAGVPAVARCHDDFIHGFHAMLAVDDARAAAVDIARRVGTMVRTGHPGAVPDGTSP